MRRTFVCTGYGIKTHHCGRVIPDPVVDHYCPECEARWLDDRKSEVTSFEGRLMLKLEPISEDELHELLRIMDRPQVPRRLRRRMEAIAIATLPRFGGTFATNAIRYTARDGKLFRELPR